MDALCQTVLEYLEAGTPLVLATMMDTRGSAPRAAGARMLVLPDGSIAGTVGGGAYEAESIMAARELHRLGRALEAAHEAPPGKTPPGRPGAVLDFCLRGVTDMDMICGGSISLLLEYLPDSPALRAVFAAGREAGRNGQPFALIARFSPDSGGGDALTAPDSGGETLNESSDGMRMTSGELRRTRVERFALLPASRVLVPSGAVLPHPVLERAAALPDGPPQRMALEGREYLLEPFPRPFGLVIFGGGHVAVAVADLARRVGFRVTVADDRAEFAAPERFPGGTALLLPSLEEADCAALLARLNPEARDGVIIVTRGHAHDRDALAAALNTGAGYIGMIGSKSKRAAVYAELRSRGVAQERLEAVHSPIGLAIGAQTPEEIAVSIVAELIAWRGGFRAEAQRAAKA